jgi:3-oxoacyl-(acyl-carrier-protein) synthase
MVLMKNNNKKRIVVTGIGPMSSLGIGREATWGSILDLRLNLVKEKYFIGDEKWGEFYLHKMPRFDIGEFDLPKGNFRFIKELRTVTREDIDLYYLLAVIKLAIDDSNLKYESEDNNIGLVLTQENPGVETFFEELVDSIHCKLENNSVGKVSKLELAKMIYDENCEKRGYNLQTFSYLFSAAKVFDLHGYSLFINNACASGLFAVEAAARQIKTGVSSAVIVAATDNPTKIYKYLWFAKKGLYAEDGLTKPFSKDAHGIVFGDGGAALVLEDLEHAERRGAKIYAEYLGGGFSLEGWKITVPDITDDFYAKSFRKALDNSGVKENEVDFVNPHGVGMKITDAYEADAINRAFKAKKPMVSAFKPLVGHNLGGSGILETAISLLSMDNGMIPGTLNCENINEKFGLKIVRKNTKSKIGVIAKMACGFAGFNGVIIFSKFDKG